MEHQPYLASWNLTYRCNLHCAHCYVEACPSPAQDELTTQEGRALLEQLAQLSPGAMVVFSGGEPLLRQDLFPLARYGAGLGLAVVLGSNGTLIDDEVAGELARAGVAGVGISLDSTSPPFHDGFRGQPGAWARAVAGAEACRRRGLPLQIQATVSRGNQDQVDDLLRLSHHLGARVFNLFFLVCTGRGQGLSDISSQEYEALLCRLAQVQAAYPDMLVRARCAPQFVRVLGEAGSPEPWGGGAAGCLAAHHYFRITPEGDITPCPYLPLKAGNIRQATLAQIWEGSALLQELRRGGLKGKCGLCRYAPQCRGCRARAYAFSGDYLEADPWCHYQPGPEEAGPGAPREGPIWSPGARARMERAPFFIRSLVLRRIENYAREKGYAQITEEVLEEIKSKAHGASLFGPRGHPPQNP